MSVVDYRYVDADNHFDEAPDAFHRHAAEWPGQVTWSVPNPIR